MSDKLKEMFGELFGKLMEFTVRDEFYDSLGESLEVFYNLKEGEEYEFIPANEFLFLTWFLLDVEGIIKKLMKVKFFFSAVMLLVATSANAQFQSNPSSSTSTASNEDSILFMAHPSG